MDKELIPKEGIEKLKAQIKQDMVRFDVQIIQLDTQLKHLVGAKIYARQLLKKMEGEDAILKKG